MGCNQSTIKEHEIVAPPEPVVTEETPKQVEEALVEVTPEVAETTEATEEPQEEKPAEEPTTDAEAAAEEPAPEAEPEAPEEAEKEEAAPEAEVTAEAVEDADTIDEEEPKDESKENLKYAITGSSVTEDGVVLYHVEVKDTKQTFKRRYSDFKLLHSNLPANDTLPELPPADIRTFFERRDSLVKTREEKFQDLLNAIAEQDEVENSEAFKSFLE